MAKTMSLEEIPPLVQIYDYMEVKEYKKRYGGAIFSVTKTVKADVLQDYTVLDIKTARKFDKILINGEEVKL